MNRNMSTNKNKFHVFHFTRNSLNDCTSAIDEGYPRSDAERGEQCVRQCQWCCWPTILVVDIITLPVRGIIYIVKKCKNKKN